MFSWVFSNFLMCFTTIYPDVLRTLENLLNSIPQHWSGVLKCLFQLEQLTVSLQCKKWYLCWCHLLNETQPWHMHGEACFLFMDHVTRKSIYFSLKNLPINYARLKYHLDPLLNHPCHFSAGLTFCAFHEGNIYVFNLHLLAWRILLSFMKWY